MRKKQRRSPALYRLFGIGLAITALNQPAVLSKTVHSSAPAGKTAVQPKTPPDPISSPTLIGLVRSNHILDPQYPLHIKLDQNEATVATVRHPKATDQDCKIDAVLVAKTIMDAYPKEVSRVKLLLNESSSENIDEINVTTGDIKAYATGTISKDELLSSLELKRSENTQAGQISSIAPIGNTKAVVPGPYSTFRQMLASRIEGLKQNGTDTRPFESLMDKLELDVQKPRNVVPEATILEESKDLSRHLTETEQAIIQARDISSGKTAYGFRNKEALDSGFGRNRFHRNGPPGDGPNLPPDNPFRGKKYEGGFWGQGMSNPALAKRVADQVKMLKEQHADVSHYYRMMLRIKGEATMGQSQQADHDLIDLASQLGIK